MEVQFLVEDGTGLSNATSYVSVEDLKQYFFNSGYTYDDLADNDIKRMLNKATAFIDSSYDMGFPGYRALSTQALSWGRFGAYYLDGFEIEEGSIPSEIKKATNEMAYLISTGIDPNATISKDGKVLSSSVAVDVIKEAITYEEGSSMYQDIYTAIDNILYRLTGGVSNNFTLKILRVGGESP